MQGNDNTTGSVPGAGMDRHQQGRGDIDAARYEGDMRKAEQPRAWAAIEHDRLREGIERMGQQMGRLEERLGRILSPEQASGGVNPNPKTTRSPLAESLHEAADSVESIEQRLVGIISRVEI